MRKIILDTDWWTDCDDCVALRLLLRRLEKNILLGVNLNAFMKFSLPSINRFLDSENCACLLGADQTATDFNGTPRYQKPLSKHKEYPVINRPVYDSVSFFRKLLSENSEIELVEIGFLNCLYQLLLSPPDEISPYNGTELIKKSVKKIWIMGGKYDDQGEKEHNFCHTAYTAKCAKYVFDTLDVPLVLLGYETGLNVLTGNGLPRRDILGKALRAYGAVNGRHSWDPMLVLAALEDDITGSFVYQQSKVYLDDEGKNYFLPDNSSNRFILKKRFESSYYADMINEIIGANKKPKRKPRRLKKLW